MSDVYGKYDLLVALDDSGNAADWVRAHDGDFFPESPLDYVERLRQLVSSVDLEDWTTVFPIRADIDISQNCNAQCYFCFSRQYRCLDAYRAQFVSPELLDLCARNFADLGGLTLRYCGGGEPFTHPQIDMLLPIAHRHNLFLCVITNGYSLHSNFNENILDSVDQLRWSINTISENGQRIIQPPTTGQSLISVFNNIESLLAKRARRVKQDRSLSLNATCLLVPENVDEIEPLARRLRDMGVDTVSFRPVYHGLTAKWSPDALAKLDDHLQAVANLDNGSDFRVYLPKRQIQNLNIRNPSISFSDCISIFLRVVLETTTEGLAVQKCGMFRGTDSKRGQVVNLSRSFQNAWMSKSYYPDTLSDLCDSCIDLSINVTLNFILKHLRYNCNTVFARANSRNHEFQI